MCWYMRVNISKAKCAKTFLSFKDFVVEGNSILQSRVLGNISIIPEHRENPLYFLFQYQQTFLRFAQKNKTSSRREIFSPFILCSKRALYVFSLIEKSVPVSLFRFGSCDTTSLPSEVFCTSNSIPSAPYLKSNFKSF